jgi:NhaP-type Na+/H+ or K+/H+ antiporter
MPARTAVVDATFVIVFVTLIVQGTILPPILRRLKLRPKAVETAA